MLLDFLLFPVFLCVLYAIGSGALLIAHHGKNMEYPDYFYLTFGLFSIGFISVIVNFFSGVAVPATYFAIATLFIDGGMRIMKTGIGTLKTTSCYQFPKNSTYFCPLCHDFEWLLVNPSANLRKNYWTTHSKPHNNSHQQQNRT